MADGLTGEPVNAAQRFGDMVERFGDMAQRFADLAERLRSGARVLPTQLALETVCGCNARCVMCPSQGMRRPKGMLTLATHHLMADRVAESGAAIEIISHAGMGEPLRDKTLPEKVAYEKLRFPAASVMVFTNGSLLDAEMGRRLLDSGVDVVSVSINAFRPETYTATMGLSRERTYANVEAFRDLLASTSGPRPRLNVSLVRTELCGEDEVGEFVRHWTPLADAVVLPPTIAWGSGPALGGGVPRFPCLYLWKVLMVDFDGTVKPCCEDYESSVPFGNILQQDPVDVFNCETARRMRLAQLAGDFSRPGICSGCVETLEPAREWWESASPLLEPNVGEAAAPERSGRPAAAGK